jgi:hypothetical protein
MRTAKIIDFPRSRIVRKSPHVQPNHDMLTCSCVGCTETRDMLSSLGYRPLCEEAVQK